MKALLINEPGKSSLVELEQPIPAADEVLIRIDRIGFCGSDLSTFRGLNPLVNYPRIPGHEIGATIETKGAEVPDEFQIGQHVFVEAVGLPQTFRSAVDEVCFAGRVVYIGWSKAPVAYETKYFIV